jgi:N-acetylglucosamine transport system permease protein
MIPIQLSIVPLSSSSARSTCSTRASGCSWFTSRSGFPFSVFVLSGFFRGTLPPACTSRHFWTGAGEFPGVLARDAPAARPGLITVAIFLFLGNWNEFFVAFITMSAAAR